MTAPKRLGPLADEVFCRLLEVAWAAEGLAWSPEPARQVVRMPWEDEAGKGGDGW